MIRKIRESDREWYINAADEFYHSSAVSHSVPRENFVRAFEHMTGGGAYFDGYIIEHENERAGFCAAAKSYSQEAGGIVLWIEDLYILPQYRSMGLGGEMFDYLEKEYEGIAVRWRLEITPENDGARRLYERRGFEVIPYVNMIREM